MLQTVYFPNFLIKITKTVIGKKNLHTQPEKYPNDKKKAKQNKTKHNKKKLGGEFQFLACVHLKKTKKLQ